MGLDQSSYVFILGCERSGSTWLSNIIDANPDVEFFMEPFATQIDIFPGFPERNFYLENCRDNLLEFLKGEYEKLPQMKYLFYKRGNHFYIRILDSLAVLFYAAIVNALRCRVPRRLNRILELTLIEKI